MIGIEISDESIIAYLYFMIFSVIVGWLIVQWDLNRYRNRYRKKLRMEREKE